jgi:pimeloyl-ACP methyl ester carboxylesterase
MTITPFRIDVSNEDIRDLFDRLNRTRWPDPSPLGDWVDGSDEVFLKRLVGYWSSGFDWRKQEESLNELPQFTAELNGGTVHFIHQRGTGPHPLPLVLGHGWPQTGFDLRRLIPLLSDPAGNGGDASDAFDVVAPSLPGYGFSGRPSTPGTGPRQAAQGWASLMTELGYDRFGVQSGDWGAAVAMWLALDSPEVVTGLHINFLPGFYQPPLGDGLPPLSDAEATFLTGLRGWFEAEGGYHRLQSTKPQTPSYALTDSPAGLAGWIVEKMRGWSDSHGDIESVFTLDEILTNLSLYWFTGTIASSMRFYRENALAPNRFAPGQRVEPPFGFAAFPTDPVPPREWLERVFDVRQYTVMPRGGHFAAWEEPQLLAEQIREFFRPLRTR